MRIAKPLLIGAAAAAVVLTTACERITQTDCIEGTPAIEAYVQTSSGTWASPGATVVARAGAYVDTVGPIVFPYYAEQAPVWLGDRAGTYTVTVHKPFWSTAPTEVTVTEEGRCGYPQTRRITLAMTLDAGAPPVRSVAVAPRWIRFSACGAQGTAVAHVDAESGLSGQVEWRTADSTVATVNDRGVITARGRGSTEIRARAVADTTVVGAVPVAVDATC